MAVFDVSVPQIEATAAKIGLIKKNLAQTKQALQESMEGARSAWICDSADRFFSECSEAVKGLDQVISFAGSVEVTLEKDSGNYISNEKKEVDIVKQIHSAYL